MDDVKGKTKGQSVSSSQTVRELQSNTANQLQERIRHMKLHQHFNMSLSVPPMYGIYNWSDHLKLPQQGQGSVLFSTDCSNDVHVAISPQSQSVNPMYEFVIGGWSNTESVVRRKSQGPKLCTVPVGLNKPQLDTVNDLWISIDKNTKLLQVGRGREPNFESVFFIYKDPRFLFDAQYVCFTTWNVPATYSNIMVLAME